MKKNVIYPVLLFILFQCACQAKTIDLAIKNFKVSTASDGIGAIVNLSTTLVNLGDSIPVGNKLKFYYSKDTL